MHDAARVHEARFAARRAVSGQSVKLCRRREPKKVSMQSFVVCLSSSSRGPGEVTVNLTGIVQARAAELLDEAGAGVQKSFEALRLQHLRHGRSWLCCG